MENTKMSGVAIAALAAAFFVTGCAGTGTAKTDLANMGGSQVGSKVKCYSANACKGQSACKSGKHACKGQNACSGQGFMWMGEGECMTMLEKRLPQS
jgi:hypothetical protein